MRAFINNYCLINGSNLRPAQVVYNLQMLSWGLFAKKKLNTVCIILGVTRWEYTLKKTRVDVTRWEPSTKTHLQFTFYCYVIYR